MSWKAEAHDVRGAYDAWHGDLDVDSAADAPWHRLVKQHLSVDRDVAGKRILEIACGRGGLACWLATSPQPPFQIVGADYSATAIQKAHAFAEQNRLSRIVWQVGDIQAIAHPAASFDTVISCETVEHVPNPKKAITELARVLRRGGKLLLTTPNYLGTLGLYRIYLRVRGRRFTEVGQPINNFTLLPRTRRWVTQAGLKIIAVDGVGHYVPIPGRPSIRLETLDSPRQLMRWFGLHSLILATKP